MDTHLETAILKLHKISQGCWDCLNLFLRCLGFGDLAFGALGSRTSVSGLGCRIISNVYHSITARYCKYMTALACP